MINIHKRILSGAVCISLILHTLALAFLQSYSLWFSTPVSRPLRTSSNPQERSQILKEAFAAPGKIPDAERRQTPRQEPTTSLAQTLPPEQETPPPFTLFSSLPLQHLLVVNEPILPSFTLPERPLSNVFEHLPKDLCIPAHPTSPPAVHFPTPASLKFQLLSEPCAPPEAPPSFQSTALTQSASLKEIAPTVKAPSPPSVPFPKLPTLSELHTTNASDCFDAEISFLPQEDSSGYLFAITLLPRLDLQLPTLKQHYTFLIDRSNSIQKERLQAVKIGVLRALEELRPEDTFNLFVFDSKAEKLSPSPLSANSASLAQAENFLSHIELGSFFSSANLDRPLMLTVPGYPKDDEVHTAILLTDGETLSKRGEQYALLSNWSSYNRGKVSLFPVSMASDAHLATLELAAKSNKGKLVCAPTQRGFKRKLLKLMHSLHAPLAKNIACRTVPSTKNQTIDLYPKPFQAAHLYLDQPYVLIGKTQNLEDFILFVQGRFKDGWLNIKKKISFTKARKGNRSLKAEWALQTAQNLYEKYLQDQNPAHLAEARALLAPYDYQVAFE